MLVAIDVRVVWCGCWFVVGGVVLGFVFGVVFGVVLGVVLSFPPLRQLLKCRLAVLVGALAHK